MLQPHEYNVIHPLSVLTLEIMTAQGIQLRRSPNLEKELPRVTKIESNQKAHFRPGTGHTIAFDDNFEEVVEYPVGQVVFDEETFEILFEKKTASDSYRHYRQSLVVHELVHYYQFVTVNRNTGKEDYISQGTDIEGYFKQRREMEAFGVQSIFYHRINKSELPIADRQLQKMINSLLALEEPTVAFRFDV
jgi:hypothetical protein